MQKLSKRSRSEVDETKPSVSVVLPGALAALFPGSTTHLELEATNVSELLNRLDQRWPGMCDRLRDSRPAIRKHINIFVDGQRASLKTPLAPGARVYILTAMSGG
jgi:molybdopterin converting factor small subunit